jgi:hypothetical protein
MFTAKSPRSSMAIAAMEIFFLFSIFYSSQYIDSRFTLGNPWKRMENSFQIWKGA